MKYKVEYQFRWVLVLGFIILIYLSNLILIKLPFISIYFPEKEIESGLFAFLLSLFPRINFEMQVYSLQTVTVWTCGAIFGPRVGAIMLLIYLLIGFFGVPIFAGGGGLDYYKEPTFGYLISLPFNAYLSGYFYQRDNKTLAILIPMVTTHLLGILYLLLFKRSMLDISWHLSFSMIGYDLIFALLLTPLIPIFSFILKEMIMQEVPTRETLYRDNL